VKDSLDAAATSFLKNTLRTWGTPRATAIQHGTLHGKPFVRCVWTATSPNGGETAGTLYLTVFEQQSRRQFVSFVTAMPMKDNDATRRILLPANQSVLSFLPVEGPVNVTASPLGDGRILEPGVRLREVTLQRDDTAAKERLWIYLPDPLPATPIPCIFLAPAGTRPFNGVTLGDNDRPEHLPYVHAGYAVVAYDTDGEWGGSRVPDDQFVNILGQFRQARAGLVNAHAAIDYSLAQLPQIDPKRLYVAGHGSAGSLALLAAEYEPRIAGCLAYAPCTDIFAQVDADHRAKLDHALPGEEDFLAWCSPITAVDRLKCPVFLFQADDDSLYPIARTEQFVQKLQDTNKDVTFTRARKGGHYSAMISQGIPAGIQWLKKQSKPSDAAPNVASAR